MNIHFNNPASFMPVGLLDYLDAVKKTAFVKRSPFDFIVLEPVQGMPGRYVTPGPNSDFADVNLDLRRPHRMVAATLVKERLTTSDACGRLAKALSRTLGRYIDPESIQNSGLKDRWALTAQTVQIPGVTVDEIRRCVWNYTPGRAGFFLKDIRPAFEELEMGDHKANRFQLIIRADGMSAKEIEDYLEPKLSKLAARGMWIPNAYGRQRLGRRQNLHVIGRTLVTGDFKAPADVPQFGSPVEAGCFQFLFHSTQSEPAAARAVREQAAGYWLYNFDEMRALFEKNFKQFNLSLEHKMAERLADVERYGGSFENVLASMKKDSSLFVAAWQSWWWNLVLARKLPGWVREMDESRQVHEAWSKSQCTCGGARHNCTQHEEDRRSRSPLAYSLDDACSACECDRCSSRPGVRFNPAKKSIPVLMSTPEARSFYGRLSYAQPALRELDKASAFVRDTFLLPRGRANDPRGPRGPWRKAFIKVENLTHHARDGEWHVEFDLRSGAYATTFLGQLWNLADPDEVPDCPAPDGSDSGTSEE